MISAHEQKCENKNKKTSLESRKNLKESHGVGKGNEIRAKGQKGKRAKGKTTNCNFPNGG